MEKQKQPTLIQPKMKTKKFQQKSIWLKKQSQKQKHLAQLVQATNIKFIYGDLLKSSTKYIAHQCNCETKYAKGLSQQMFQKYEKANTYNKIRKQGTIDIININEKRTVINIYAQKKPGKPNYLQNREIRKKWFCEALQKISQVQQIKQIGIPNKIGCGLAGGNWLEYLLILLQWSLSKKIQLYVYCYRQGKQQNIQGKQYLLDCLKSQF